MTISYTDTAKKTDLDSAQAMLADDEIVRGVMPFRQKVYDAGGYGENRETISVNLIVPADAASFLNYINLRDRLTREKLPVPEKEVIISEKLASRLGVVRGDDIYLESGGERFAMTVAGISENYYMHYIYMHELLYTELFDEKPAYNAMYVLFGEHGEDQKYGLTNRMLEKKGVGAIFLTSTAFKSFNRVVNSLNFVILILIVSAASLAVVVLLNLTNINIGERKRELATIEVLGFYDREMSAYIYRENLVLTLIGTAAGLVLGVALHSFVIRTAETDFMMFGREIKPWSFLYSAALTFFFASFVNVITSRQLRKINMVEALKSVE
jgi:putative ABC transport system permease protein